MDLDRLRADAAKCTACDLYRDATQTVFGEGPADAEVMLVGEQPGDQEDRQGHPFVGPAGRVLDDGLQAAGIDRNTTYVTNAVKHFKFEPRGKRRIHKKPSAGEVAACHPWLDAEIEAVGPRIIVALGATAAQALMGRSFRLTQHRGEIYEQLVGPVMTATVHPSSILRAEDDQREAAMEAFVADLKVVRDWLADQPAARAARLRRSS